MNRMEVGGSKFTVALILNFIFWGSGGLLLKRSWMDAVALLLHLYLYFLFLVLIWVPAASIGGYYFTQDLRRRVNVITDGKVEEKIT